MKLEEGAHAPRTFSSVVDITRHEPTTNDDCPKEGHTIKHPQHSRVVELIRQDSLRSNSNSLGMASVDFKTAIDKAGYGMFNYFLLLIAFPATCTSSFDTTALALVLPIAGCELNLSTVEHGALNSASYAGMIASAFLWGFLSDNYGRQKLLVVGYLLDALMGVISAFAQTFWSMALFRFLSGFMICGPYSIFMTYLSEVFDSSHSDVAVMSSGLYYALGSVIQPAIAMAIVPLDLSTSLPFGMELSSWRIFLLISSIPSLLSGIASMFCVESPKFLLDQGRKEEALTVFKKIYTLNTGLPPNTYPVKRLHSQMVTSSAEKKHDSKSLSNMLKSIGWHATALFRPPHLKSSLFTFSLQFALITVLNLVRLWLPQLFAILSSEDSTASNDNSTMCTIISSSSMEEDYNEELCKEKKISSGVYLNVMIIYSACFFGSILTNISVKYIKKKHILIFTVTCSAVCIILMPMLASAYVLPLAAIYISLLNGYFYVLIAVIVEIYPTSLRATSVSLALMFGRLGLFVSTTGLTELLYIQCELVFYLLGLILIVMSITSVFLPQSADLPKEESNK